MGLVVAAKLVITKSEISKLSGRVLLATMAEWTSSISALYFEAGVQI
jgi:hypothetical protein